MSYVKLSDIRSTAFTSSNRFDSHDLNGVSTRAMTSAHVSVALCDGSLGGQITVLTVHVVCARARVVSQPDGEVLDLEWFTLINLF